MSNEMSRCATCRHWVEGDNHRLSKFPVNVRVCEKTKHLGEATGYSLDRHHRPLKAEYISLMAFVLDCEEYGADLLTTADFGCVQWEA